MAYTTKDKIKEYMGKDVPSSISDATVTSWIASVKAWIDRYCNTTFESDADSTKYYDGNGYGSIEIDPFTAITTLKILQTNGDTMFTLTEGDGNDFLAYPLNETEKFRVVLTGVAQTSHFPRGHKSVQVTGRFRSATSVPDAIQLVATQLMARLIEGKGTAQGKEVTKESLGDYSIEFSTESVEESAEALSVYSILDQYKKYEI